MLSKTKEIQTLFFLFFILCGINVFADIPVKNQETIKVPKNRIKYINRAKEIVHERLIKIGKGFTQTISVFIDKDQYIWVSTEDGVYRYDGHGDFVLYSNISTKVNYVDTIYEEADATLIFMNMGKKMEYFALPRNRKNDPNYKEDSISTEENVRKNFNNSKAPRDSLLSQYLNNLLNSKSINKENITISCVSQKSKGEYILGTEEGWLIILNTSTKIISLIQISENTELLDVSIDSTGTIWILSPTHLWKYKSRETLVVSMASNQKIWGITKNEMKSNSYYVVTNQNTQSNVLEIMLEEDSIIYKTLINDAIPAKSRICFQEDDEIIILGINSFFSLKKRKLKNKSNHYSSNLNAKKSIAFEYAIPLENSSKRLIATRGEGLDIYNKGTIYPIKVSEKWRANYDSLNTSLYYLLKHPSKSHTYWGTSTESGLIEFFIEEDSLKQITPMLNIDFKEIITIQIDEEKKNLLWIGTHFNGLLSYDLNTNEVIQVFDKMSGMLSEKIYSIVQWKGHIWFYTGKGLGCLFKKKTPVFLGLADGLPSLDGSGKSSAVLNNRLLFFGTTKGAVYFNPDSLIPVLETAIDTATASKVKTYIDCYKNGKPLKFGEKNVSLNHGDFFQVRVASSDYYYSDLMKYKYELVKIDSDTERVIDSMIILGGVLTNLDITDRGFGKFKLNIFTKSRGEWSKPETITISLPEPLSQKWWFRLLSGLGILGLLPLGYQINKYKEKKRREKELEISKVKEKILEEKKQNEKELEISEEKLEVTEELLSYSLEVIANRGCSLDEVSKLYYKTLKKFNLTEYNFAISIRFGDDGYKFIKYNEEGNWKEENQIRGVKGKFHGWVILNGKELVINNMEDKNLWKDYTEKIDVTFAIKGKSMVIIPIVNNDTEVLGTISVQSLTPREYTLKELGLLRKLAKYFPKIYNINQHIKPGVYFWELVSLAYINWINDEQTKGIPLFHFTFKNRPNYYSCIDLLFRYSATRIDALFGLDETGYNHEQLLNLIFKGFGRYHLENDHQLDSKKSVVSLGAFLLLFTASFDNIFKNEKRNPFISCWKDYPHSDSLSNIFRNEDMRRVKKVEAGKILQAIFYLGQCIFRNPNNKNNIQSIDLNIKEEKLTILLDLDNAELQYKKYQDICAGLVLGRNENTTKALYKVKQLTKEQSFNVRLAPNSTTPDLDKNGKKLLELVFTT